MDAHALRAFLGHTRTERRSISGSAGGFTSEAEREARAEQRQLTLIELDRLVGLWIEFSYSSAMPIVNAPSAWISLAGSPGGDRGLTI